MLVNYKQKRYESCAPEKYNFFYQMKFNTEFFIKFILARNILRAASVASYSSFPLCITSLYLTSHILQTNLFSCLTWKTVRSSSSYFQMSKAVSTFVSPGAVFTFECRGRHGSRRSVQMNKKSARQVLLLQAFRLLLIFYLDS